MAIFPTKNELSRAARNRVASEGPRRAVDDEAPSTSIGSERRLRRSYFLPSAASAINYEKLINKLVTASRRRRSKSLSSNWRERRSTKLPAKPTLKQLENLLSHNPNRSLQYDSSETTASVPRVSKTPANTLNEETSQDVLESYVSSPDRSHGSTISLDARNSNESDRESHHDNKAGDGSEGSSVFEAELSLNSRSHITGHMIRVRDTRDEIRDAFKRMRTEQVQLHSIRRTRNDAYQKVKSAVQATFPTNPHLRELFQQLDVLDLSYQRAETVVEDIVNEAQQWSFRLELEERTFFTDLIGSDTSSESGSLSRTSSRETLLGIWSDRSEDMHPLLEDLQDSLDEIELAKETQYEVIESLQAMRAKPPSTQTEREVLLMNELDRVRLQSQQDILTWSARAELLEQKCRAQNLLKAGHKIQERIAANQCSPSDDIYLEELDSDNDEDDEVGSPGNHRALVHPSFGFILSNPSHLLKDPPETAKTSLLSASQSGSLSQRQSLLEDAKKEIEIESLLAPTSSSSDKASFIDRWLLHILRLSPLEVELLLVQLRSVLQIDDSGRWQHDVLSFWYEDDAAILPEYNFQNISSNNSESAQGSSQQSLAPETMPTITAHQSV